MTGFGQGTGQRPRFPALDPELPPRPWWQRLAVPAAVLVTAGVVATVVVFWPFSRGASRLAAVGTVARGWIVAAGSSGELALADLGDGRVRQAPGAGNVGDMVAASPGNRYLALFNGQVIAIRPGPALAVYPSRVPLSSETTIAWPDPFADHGQAVVMLKDYGTLTSSGSPISVVSIATGHVASLGAGDHVAGDPQGRGAFVAVPAAAAASAAASRATPDSRIELREVARSPAVLATASGLDRVLGEPAGTAVSLAAYPNPPGTEIAVTVWPTAAGSPSGVVILARDGQVLGRVKAALGAQSIPVWSPSGRSLALLATSTGGKAQLEVWSRQGGTTASTLPPSGSIYSTCVWSPDARAVLCSGPGGGRWAIARPGDARAVAVRGAGVPLAWLP